MKKLLGSTLALALLLPGSANAELLKNLKLGGQLDVQTTSADNVTDFVTRESHDHIGSANTRTMIKLDWDLLDDVHARISIAKGNLTATGTSGAVRAYGDDAQSVQTAALTDPRVTEASVKIDKLFGFTDLTLGRQYYGEAGDLVIYFGPRDNYGMTVQALDAGRFDWNGENLSLTGVVGKLNNGAGGLGAGVGNRDIRGLVVSMNKNENVKGSFYVYNQLTHATGAIGQDAGKNSNLYVVGLKGKLTLGGLMASAEFDKNMGEDRTVTPGHQNYKGFALLAKAAFKADIQNVGAFTPWGEFGYGTGDQAATGAGGNTRNGNRAFQSINTDYRPGGIYGRFDTNSAQALGSAPSNGLTNRIIWGAGFKATPAAIDKLTMGLAFYKYAFHTRAADDVPNVDSATSRYIGSEFDLTTEWKHSENVSIKGTLGSFQPGKYIAQVHKLAGAGNNPATMAALDFSIKF